MPNKSYSNIESTEASILCQQLDPTWAILSAKVEKDGVSLLQGLLLQMTEKKTTFTFQAGPSTVRSMSLFYEVDICESQHISWGLR